MTEVLQQYWRILIIMMAIAFTIYCGRYHKNFSTCKYIEIIKINV